MKLSEFSITKNDSNEVVFEVDTKYDQENNKQIVLHFANLLTDAVGRYIINKEVNNFSINPDTNKVSITIKLNNGKDSENIIVNAFKRS